MRVGTSQDQDIRFSDKTKKLLKTVNFPKILSEKVDISKVNLDVLRPWIAKRVTELLGFEDEICIEFVYHLLVDEPDPKQIQIKLMGFLEESTFKFMKELWTLIVSAEKTVGGIPREFLEEAKKEMHQMRVFVNNKERDLMIQQELRKVREKEIPDRSRSRERRSRDRHGSTSRERRSKSKTRYRSRSRSRSRHRYRSRSRSRDRYERRDRYRSREYSPRERYSRDRRESPERYYRSRHTPVRRERSISRERPAYRERSISRERNLQRSKERHMEPRKVSKERQQSPPHQRSTEKNSRPRTDSPSRFMQ